VNRKESGGKGDGDEEGDDDKPGFLQRLLNPVEKGLPTPKGKSFNLVVTRLNDRFEAVDQLFDKAFTKGRTTTTTTTTTTDDKPETATKTKAAAKAAVTAAKSDPTRVFLLTFKGDTSASQVVWLYLLSCFLIAVFLLAPHLPPFVC
jgi:hypothetical protein